MYEAEKIPGKFRVNELVVGNMEMVQKLAGWYSKRVGVCYDELLSAGYEGLCRAALRYEEGKGSSFWAYAEEVVVGHILDCVRFFVGRYGHEVVRNWISIESILECNPHDLDRREVDIGYLSKFRYFVDGEEVIRKREDGRAVQFWSVIKSVLGKVNAMIVSMYYVRGMTFNEIGQVLQVSESRVCQIMGRIERKLKNDEQFSQFRGMC